MCATSEPGAVVIGIVGAAPRATTIHAGTAIAIAAAAMATYVPLERLVRRHSSIRVRNASMRFLRRATGYEGRFTKAVARRPARSTGVRFGRLRNRRPSQ